MKATPQQKKKTSLVVRLLFVCGGIVAAVLVSMMLGVSVIGSGDELALAELRATTRFVSAVSLLVQLLCVIIVWFMWVRIFPAKNRFRPHRNTVCISSALFLLIMMAF